MSSLHPSIDDPEKHFLGNLLSDEDSFTQHQQQQLPSRERSGIPHAAVISGVGPVGPSPNQNFWPEPPPPYSPPHAGGLWMSSNGFTSRMMGTMKEPSEWDEFLNHHNHHSHSFVSPIDHSMGDCPEAVIRFGVSGGPAVSSQRPLHANPVHSLPTSPVETPAAPKLPFSYRDVVNRGVRAESLSCLLPGKDASCGRPLHSPPLPDSDALSRHSPLGNGSKIPPSDRKETTGDQRSGEFQKITRKKGGKSSKEIGGPSSLPPPPKGGKSSKDSGGPSSLPPPPLAHSALDAHSRFEVLQKLPAKASSEQTPVKDATSAWNGKGERRWGSQQVPCRKPTRKETDRRARGGRRREDNGWIRAAQAALLWLLSLSECGLHWIYELLSDVVLQCYHLCRHGLCSLDEQVRMMSRCAVKTAATAMRECTLSWWNSLTSKNTNQPPINAWGLEHNIRLPNNCEEALARLLSVRSEDAYVVLGVREDAPDDEIRRYYKRQAVFVHPDKNPSEGAAEAFQVLCAAFEAVGTAEARALYDQHRFLQSPVHKELTQLCAKLRAKVEEARNSMECGCGQKHVRVPATFPPHSARYCRRCGFRHPAKSGDLWAESRMFGLIWVYYTCVNGVVYDITPWASCQTNAMKKMSADSHSVLYTLHAASGGQSSESSSETQQPFPNDFDYAQIIKHLSELQKGATGLNQAHASLRPPADREEDRPRKAKKSSKRK